MFHKALHCANLCCRFHPVSTVPRCTLERMFHTFFADGIASGLCAFLLAEFICNYLNEIWENKINKLTRVAGNHRLMLSVSDGYVIRMKSGTRGAAFIRRTGTGGRQGTAWFSKALPGSVETLWPRRTDLPPDLDMMVPAACCLVLTDGVITKNM